MELAPFDIKAPASHMNFCMPDGTRYTADDSATISNVAKHHVMPLIAAGCKHAPDPMPEAVPAADTDKVVDLAGKRRGKADK